MKKLLSLVLALAMMLSIASIAAAEPTTITVWATDGAETVVYTQMFEDFNAKNTEIQVDFQPFPQDELLNKLSTADVVGDTPEVIIIDGLQIPYFQDLDMIACIDDYITDEMKADVLPSVWAENTYDGKIYGVAQFDSGMGMWTRKSELEKLGVRIPESYTDAWTVEEFEDILAKAKEAGYAFPLYIRQNKATSLYFTWMPIIASYGGDFLNRDTMTATGALDSETSLQVMDILKEIASDRLVIMVTHNPELAELYATRTVRLLDGVIIGEYRGTGGFGYDPLFLSDDLGMTFARVVRHKCARASNTTAQGA